MNKYIIILIIFTICLLFIMVECKPLKYKYIHTADYQGAQCTGNVIAGSYSLNDACPNRFTHQRCNEDGSAIEMIYYSGEFCTGDITGKELIPTNNCTSSEFLMTCTEEAIYPYLNTITFYYNNGTCLDIDNPSWINSITDIDYTIINACFSDQNGAFSYQCNSTSIIKSIYKETTSCTTLLETGILQSGPCDPENSPFVVSCNQQMNQ